MQTDAVDIHHWMTDGQFLNAVALGQLTPGPVVQTVAAVGYAAAGLGGAILASVVAFAPSFVLVFAVLGGGRFERLRTNLSARAFLDGAGPAAVGAILGTLVPLSQRDAASRGRQPSRWPRPPRAVRRAVGDGGGAAGGGGDRDDGGPVRRPDRLEPPDRSAAILTVSVVDPDQPSLLGPDLPSPASRTAPIGPLADRMRPRAPSPRSSGRSASPPPGAPLRAAIESGQPHSLILWGPPGVGKTTIARAIAASSDASFEQLNAVTDGMEELRAVIERAEQRRQIGRRTLLFVDEVAR